MPTTANTINYYVAADGTLRDGPQGSISQQPRINYGTEYAVTLSFPASTIAEGDQLQVALNRTRTFFSSASATGDAPVAAVAKHEVTAEEAAAQEVAVVLSTNTRAMIDQVNGIDHPVRGFFGVHVLRGQSFVTLAVADALMMSLESGPDAISPPLPILDYPTREEAVAIKDEALEAAGKAKEEADRAEEAAAGIVPPLQLSSPPTTSTVGSVGQLAVWHDSATNKDHLYHLCFVSEGESATLYHWEECVLVSQGNVAGGFAGLDAQGKLTASQLPVLHGNSAPTTSTAGVIGQTYSDDTNVKIYTCVSIGGTEQEPQYNWKEGVYLESNGKLASAILPIATSSEQGAVKINSNFGIVKRSDDVLTYSTATAYQIDLRNGTYSAIVARESSLDYAVRSVCKNITEIPAATSDYSLVDSSATTNNHSHVYSHSPSVVPTYRLPQVTNTAIAHYIELTVDFTAVQTYSFLDYQGEPIVPLFTPSIAAGDVYTFKMEYSAIKAAWLIYPQKQGAVADDFVMRGEVGAANGVAGLDANAKVPSEQLPTASGTRQGAVKANTTYGTNINFGYVTTSPASNNNIDARNGSAVRLNYAPIVPSNLNYAVTAALTDSNHITLTDAQKATAQEVFGVGGPITAIPAATSQYTLSYGRFSHVPELASVYVLPAVADGTLANDIMLSIKFSTTVLTYEFQDSAGNTLVPLPLNGDIEAGSVVTFLCRYNLLLAQWVIYPVMDGKEVTP